MNRTTLQRALVFILVVAAAVLVIYNARTRQEKKALVKAVEQQQKVEIAAAEKKRMADETAEKAAEELRKLERAAAQTRYVNQYINTNISRTAGLPLIAVAVATENNTMNHAVGSALVTRFRQEHATFVDSFFKPPLVSDGLFPEVFNGSRALFARLEITNSVDGLLLARQDVQYSTNTTLLNVITANMRLEIVALPVAGHIENHGWTFTGNGSGFHPAEARMQAEARILKQITDNTNMFLGLPSSNL